MIWFQIDFKDITAQPFYRVVEWENVNSFAVFDVKTLVDVHEISELHPQVVASDLVHLNTTLFHIIRAQADKNSISPLIIETEMVSRCAAIQKNLSDVPNGDRVSTKQGQNLHRCGVKCRDSSRHMTFYPVSRLVAPPYLLRLDSRPQSLRSSKPTLCMVRSRTGKELR
jgi:hypothetical protein